LEQFAAGMGKDTPPVGLKYPEWVFVLDIRMAGVGKYNCVSDQVCLDGIAFINFSMSWMARTLVIEQGTCQRDAT
jgi:hypothetical protein